MNVLASPCVFMIANFVAPYILLVLIYNLNRTPNNQDYLPWNRPQPVTYQGIELNLYNSIN